MNIVLYTTHCPQCRGVEALLKSKKINYVENTDVDKMLSLGIKSVPVLSVDDKLFFGRDIYSKINELGK